MCTEARLSRRPNAAHAKGPGRGDRQHHLFWHLRHWNREALIDRLESLSPHDEIQQLSQQLLAMSELNWRKHRLLQGAISAAVLGSVLIGVAVTWP